MVPTVGSLLKERRCQKAAKRDDPMRDGAYVGDSYQSRFCVLRNFGGSPGLESELLGSGGAEHCPTSLSA